MWHIKYGKVYSNHEFQFEIMWQRMHINFSLCQPYMKGLWNGDKQKMRRRQHYLGGGFAFPGTFYEFSHHQAAFPVIVTSILQKLLLRYVT